jgi:UDP-N-acetylglucosamine 3-dehydrogenase
MRRFDVAVLGVGYWGKKIVEEYNNIPSVNVKAISDQVDKNLEFCRDRYGVKNLHHDYKEVLEDKGIAAVNVCLPNKLHFQAAKDALEAGKHVLVEKPLALSSQEGMELVNLAEESNLTLSVGHIYRFNNAMNEVRRLMKQNFFGRPFLMNLMWMNLEPSYPDRDVIVDLAPHTFDITNFIFDAWPVKIGCTGKAYRRKEMEETAFISAEMPSGAISHTTISWLAPRKVRQVEVIGENRSALIDAVGQEVTIYESGYTYRLGVERNNTIQTELVHFLQSIGDPLTETRNSGMIGLRTVEMIEAAKRSLAEGRIIEVPQEK